MSNSSGIEAAFSVDVRGAYGFTAGLGLTRCGHSRYGSPKDFGGIYAIYHTLEGPRLKRVRYMRPTNPQTTAQQAWRAKVAEGWAGYNALTPTEKASLSRKARRLRLSGPQLFMSQYLKSQAA